MKSRGPAATPASRGPVRTMEDFMARLAELEMASQARQPAMPKGAIEKDRKRRRASRGGKPSKRGPLV